MNPPTPPSCRGLVLLARMTGGSGDFAVERFFTFDPPPGVRAAAGAGNDNGPSSPFPTKRPSAKVPSPQGGQAPKCLPHKAVKRQSAFPTRRPSAKVPSPQGGQAPKSIPHSQVDPLASLLLLSRFGGIPPLGVLGSSTGGGTLKPPTPPAAADSCCCWNAFASRGVQALGRGVFLGVLGVMS